MIDHYLTLQTTEKITGYFYVNKAHERIREKQKPSPDLGKSITYVCTNN
jgi:hypothetical protein